MAELKREMEFELPCGEAVRAYRPRRGRVWCVEAGGEHTDIDLTRRNAEAIIKMIRELSKNTPGGIR